jgi:hypothetical protein
MRKAVQLPTPQSDSEGAESSGRDEDHSPVRTKVMADRGPRIAKPLKVHEPRKLHRDDERTPASRLGAKVVAANREPPRAKNAKPVYEEQVPTSDKMVGYVELKSGKTALYRTIAGKYYTVNASGNKRYVTARVESEKLKVYTR